MAESLHSSTEAAAHGAAGGAFPPFQSETFASQIIWFAIAFGLLYWLMSRVALPRVAGVLHERSARLAKDLEEAQALKTQSETAGAAYEKSLADARNAAKAIAQEKRDALSAETEAKRKMLDAELSDKIAASEAAIRSRTADAMGNVRGIAVETASAIVERLTGTAPDRAAVEAAVDGTPRA